MKTIYYATINGQRIEANSLKELRKSIKSHVKKNNLTYRDVSMLFCEKSGKIVRCFER